MQESKYKALGVGRQQAPTQGPCKKGRRAEEIHWRQNLEEKSERLAKGQQQVMNQILALGCTQIVHSSHPAGGKEYKRTFIPPLYSPIYKQTIQPERKKAGFPKLTRPPRSTCWRKTKIKTNNNNNQQLSIPTFASKTKHEN